MNMSARTNQTISTLLWTAVGLLIGLTIGLLIQAEARTLLFLGVAGAGGVLIIRLNRKRPRADKPDQKPTALPIPQTPAIAPTASKASKPTKQKFSTASLTDDHIFTPDEARAWLDDLLQQQQK